MHIRAWGCIPVAAVVVATTPFVAAAVTAAPKCPNRPSRPVNQKEAVRRAWDGIDSECREKLKDHRTVAGVKCLIGHFREMRLPEAKRGGDFLTTLRKLRHDAEAFTWLEDEGHMKDSGVKKLYRGIYRAARPDRLEKPDKVFEVSFNEENDDRKLWTKTHNKAAFMSPSLEEVPKKVIKASSKTLKAAEAGFAEKGHAVVDKVFTDRALWALRHHLQESMVYFYPQKSGYLLALLEDGLASPLLATVADSVRVALPEILGHLPLTGGRAWKADNSPLVDMIPGNESQVDLSGDAEVAVLLWVVQGNALNGTAKSQSALTLSPDFEDEPAASIKYASNRLVMWGSGLIPRWESPGWKAGYLKRGVHLVLYFGESGCSNI